MSTFHAFIAVLVLCCGYALLRGGACEVIAAALQLAAYLIGFLMPRLDGPGGGARVATGFYLIDAALLVCLAVLAIRSTRFWPLWIAGFQTAAVIAHTAKMLDPTMLAFGYALQVRGWAYPMLLVMAVGTWRHVRRRRRDGADPPWKPLGVRAFKGERGSGR